MNSTKLIKLFRKTLRNSSPSDYINKNIKFKNNILFIKNKEFKIEKNISIIAFGKASLSMFKGLKDVLGIKNIENALIISHLEKLPKNSKKIKYLKSSHPYVSIKSLEAGKEIYKFVSNLNENNKLIVLVSGGGSAMISYPIKEISFRQKKLFLSQLLTSGTPEREVNTIRKSLSRIKGGGLADATRCKEIINLILSDERSHKFDAISSGPTVYSRGIDPFHIIKKYNLSKLIPKNIISFYKNFDINKVRGDKKKIYNYLVGSRDNFISDFSKELLNNNVNKVFQLKNEFNNDAYLFASRLRKKYNKIYDNLPKGNYIVLSSGEIQVKVTNLKRSRKGGRNQHLVANMMLQEPFNFPFMFFALASDGQDFINGVSGAYYSNSHINIIKKKMNKLSDNIKNFNTFKFHKDIKTLVKSKKTGHNVSDIFIFYFQKI
tara:strand:+ start:17377 stop:18678 length:1302 start_codon:yes stop_codon:yes gene_type:complete